MTGLATILVLASAILHATWNLLAKRSQDPLAFLFLMNLATMAIYAIPFGVMLRTHPIPAAGWPFIVGTGVAHVAYYLCISQAYRHGALSLAYPISRGTGVALVPLLAIPLLGERIPMAGAIGIGFVAGGMLTMHLPSFRALGQQPLGIVASRAIPSATRGRSSPSSPGSLFRPTH